MLLLDGSPTSHARQADLTLTMPSSKLFRSPKYTKAATRKLGNVHLHIDCARSGESDHYLVEAAKLLEGHPWPSKVTRVAVAKPGGHIADPVFQADYQQHTPELYGPGGSFASYLTALLASDVNDADGLVALRDLVRGELGRLLKDYDEDDVVIEIERVSALLDADTARIARPAVLRSGGDIADSKFEVHHFIDFPVSADVQFSDWTAVCSRAGVVVGGWFQFDKSDVRAFRSVRFADTPDLCNFVDETRTLTALAQRQVPGGTAHVETVVEQIVDIWRL